VSSLRTRALVSAVSAAVAAAVAAAWLASRPRSEAIRLKDDGIAAQKLLLDRKREPLAESRPGERAVRTLREPLDSDSVKSLWAFDETCHEYDPSVYFRYKPGLDLDFGDRDGVGRYHVHTSEDGYREDFVRLPAKRDLFVVVVGDSHTDGVCENKESYSNRLEAALQGDRPGRTVEVLNAGNGGFSLYNYLGVLEKFLDLRPDAFVVGVYGGNDFREVLFPLAYFGRTTVEEDTPAEKQELERGRRLDARAMNQSFRSILGFRGHPQQVKRAVDAAVELVGEMQAICREHSIRMLCLYIPSPTEADWQAHADVFDRFRKDLSLTDADLRRESQMADEFLAGVRAAGTETLDAREALVAGGGPYFWNGEFHLNLVGHEKIAEALRARIASW